jgi:phospholipase/carboxylesterase
MHQRNTIFSGLKIEEAKKAVILVHGRGGDARGMLDLEQYLPLLDFAILAPQATDNTWYPFGFMAPVAANEPWLSSAIGTLHERIDELVSVGIPARNIYLVGFSQGACLMLESAARKAQRYGGIIAFTGGLIGEAIDPSQFSGDFSGTPILITTGDPDAHVPQTRVHESETILAGMGADVHVAIYPGRPHTIIADEIERARQLFLRSQ